MNYQFFIFLKLKLFPGLVQNATIEERVSLLEIQVVEIQEDVTEVDDRVDLVEGDVEFLFDETVIQDERLFSLEQTTIAITADLVAVDGELESEFLLQHESQIQSSPCSFSKITAEENHAVTNLSNTICRSTGHNSRSGFLSVNFRGKWRG